MDRPFGIGKAIADPLSGGDEVITRSAAQINEYLFGGGPDTEKEDIELGEKFGVGEVVRASWARAKTEEKEMLGAWSGQHPIVEREKPKNFLVEAQPQVEKKVDPKCMDP